MKIQHKRSNQKDGESAKAPSAEFMEYGELAVNFNEDDPAIFIKDSGDQVIRIAGSGAPGGFDGDYNSLTNKPTIGDGVLTINESNGTLIDTFSANQTGNTTITLPAGSTFDGDYNSLTNKPTIGDGAITINDNDGSTLGSFTVNQSGNSTITLPDASESVKGIVELATSAETSSGSDDTRAVHPAGLANTLSSYAQLNSPAFTGTPTAPTAGSGTNNTQLATTAFVQSAVSNGSSTPPSASESVAGIIRIANYSETLSGTSSNTSVSPRNLSQMGYVTAGSLANYPARSEVLLLNNYSEQRVQGAVNFQSPIFCQKNIAANNTDNATGLTATADASTSATAIQTRSNQFHMGGGYAMLNYTIPDQVTRSYIDKQGYIWAQGITTVQFAASSVSVLSDQKYKTNITTYNGSELSDIKTLGQSLKNYYWNEDAYVDDSERTVQQFGLIAQEAELIDSKLVKTASKKNETIITPDQTDENGNFLADAVTETTEETYKTIDLGVLVSKLLKATSELIVKTESMESALASINTAANAAGTLEQLKADIVTATADI